MSVMYYVCVSIESDDQKKLFKVIKKKRFQRTGDCGNTRGERGEGRRKKKEKTSSLITI